MIQTQNVIKVFNEITAVDDVSIVVSDREIHGLVGPDGAGKTTLMRIICGLITQDSGKVLIQGVSPDNKVQLENCFGYMPQRFSLYGDLTVSENINLFGSLYGLDKKSILERSDEILQTTDLYDFKNRYADNLSGGMKQKLSLTCALVTRPKILILDEPTFGVDPESRKDIWRILYGLNQNGMTILVSTPYMDEAELCTKISFISNGKIIATDTPSHLKEYFDCTVYKMLSHTKEISILKSYFKHLDGVDIYRYGNDYHVVMPNKLMHIAQNIFVDIMEKDILIKEPEIILPSMEDIFVYYSNKEVF